MSNLPRAWRLALAVIVLGGGFLRLAPGPGRATAAVGHGVGFHASVDGFASWYGSYHMGSLGVAWCIDHGIRAPDPDLGYRPTALAVPEATRVALAWAMGRHGVQPDAVGAAALMLVAHDLMGATYPSGRLDVDALPAGRLAGFGGSEAGVLARARAIKADALAHAGLRPPWRLELHVSRVLPGSLGSATARVTAGGVPVAGIDVTVDTHPVPVVGPATVRTGGDGTAAFAFGAATTPYRVAVAATVPDLAVQAYAPTAAPAQRVARPATVPLSAVVDQPAPSFPPSWTSTTSTTRPPTTTTATTSTTSTTRPPVTTTTSAPPRATTTTAPTTGPPATTTTTAAPPRATTTSTRPPATTTSTTAPPTTSTTAPSTTSTAPPPPTTPTTAPPTTTTAPPGTTTTAPLAPPPSTTAPPAPPSLPRTGFDPVAWAAVGTGLVLLGSALRRRGPLPV